VGVGIVSVELFMSVCEIGWDVGLGCEGCW